MTGSRFDPDPAPSLLQSRRTFPVVVFILLESLAWHCRKELLAPREEQDGRLGRGLDWELDLVSGSW